MGTAIIQSHLGGGKYRVKLLFDNALVELKLTSIDNRLTEINADLATLATDKADKKAEYDQANSDLQDYINTTPTEDIVTDPSELNRLTADTYEKMGEYQIIIKEERGLNLRKTALEKDKEYLTKYCPSEIETDIWCVQLVEDLTGTTKTIEVDYALERDPATDQIKFDTGVWLPYEVQTPDSKMQHPMASSQQAVWYNLCALPAAQKDAPRYRVATLTDANSGTIEFDGQFNTDNDISRLNNKTPIYPVIDSQQRQSYTGAALYRPCSMTDLYQDGDRVIVDCNGGSGTPTVLGFYSDPRECVFSSLPSGFAIHIKPAINANFVSIGNYSDESDIDHAEYSCDYGGFTYYFVNMTASPSINLIIDYETSVLYGYEAQIPEIIGSADYPTSNTNQFSIVDIGGGRYDVEVNNPVHFLSQTIVNLQSDLRTDYWNNITLLGVDCQGNVWIRSSDFGSSLTWELRTVNYTPIASFNITNPETSESGTYFINPSYPNLEDNVLVYTRSDLV